MSLRSILYLITVVSTGLLTLLASSITEETPGAPPVPVTVQITLSSRTNDFERDLETRTAVVSDLNFSANYASEQGNNLSIDRSSINLDTTSAFTIEVIPKTNDELLTGLADIEFGATMDVGVNHNPAAGQMTSVLDGTTTVVTVTGSGVDVLTGAATTPTQLSWSAFRDAEDDAARSLDVRMASAAFNIIAVVLRTALVGEDLIDAVENNKTTLEGLNLNNSLELDCDNTAAEGTFESRLLWTTDPTGSGQGSIGIGDAFEARYRNCRSALRARFFEGTVEASNYVPETGTGLHSFAINLDVSELFVSETQVDIDTTASDASPRYDGELGILYSESLTTLRN